MKYFECGFLIRSGDTPRRAFTDMGNGSPALAGIPRSSEELRGAQVIA